MLIPLKDTQRVMCPQSAPRDKPFGCRGRGCAAWHPVWMPGQRINLPGSTAFGVKVEIGRCGMLPLQEGDAGHEMRLRFDELAAAGLIAAAPPIKTTLTDPFFNRLKQAADEI